MSTIRIRTRGFKALAAAYAFDQVRLSRELRKWLKRAGRIVQQAQRAEFAGRLTDPRTRKRSWGPRLGTFTGHAKRSIKVRLKIRHAGFALQLGPRPGVRFAQPRQVFQGASYKAFIGPRGGAGVPGPGFYLAFHEFGLGDMPRRPIAAPATRKTARRVRRLLDQGIRRALR